MGTIGKSHFPKLVSYELMRKLKSAPWRQSTHKPRITNVTTGIIKCNCGNGYKNNKSLYCPSCNVRINKKQLNKYVWKFGLLRLNSIINYLENKLMNVQVENIKLINRINSLEKHTENLTMMLRDNLINYDMFERLARENVNEINRLKLSENSDIDFNLFSELKNEYINCDTDEKKNNWLRKLISNQRIIVWLDGNILNISFPDFTELKTENFIVEISKKPRKCFGFNQVSTHLE
jgi:hypothetical protein